MKNKVEIINSVKIEEFVNLMIDRGERHPDNREADISSHFFSFKVLIGDIEEKLHGAPFTAQLELVGYPINWKIKIVKCPWWRRPGLWWNLRKYRKNLKHSPEWDLMRGQWIDKYGKPLSESTIKRLGLNPDADSD